MSIESNLAAFKAACFSLTNQPKPYESYGGQEVEISTLLQRGKMQNPSWLTTPKKGFLSTTLTNEIDRLLLAMYSWPLGGFKNADIARQPYTPYKGKILYNQAADNQHSVQMEYALILNPTCLLRPAKAAAFFKEFFTVYPSGFLVTIYLPKQTPAEKQHG
jgi:hypothetical protein